MISALVCVFFCDYIYIDYSGIFYLKYKNIEGREEEEKKEEKKRTGN